MCENWRYIRQNQRSCILQNLCVETDDNASQCVGQGKLYSRLYLSAGNCLSFCPLFWLISGRGKNSCFPKTFNTVLVPTQAVIQWTGREGALGRWQWQRVNEWRCTATGSDVCVTVCPHVDSLYTATQSLTNIPTVFRLQQRSCRSRSSSVSVMS